MKIRKAVITAAGRGERLYPVADTVQKAMLPLMDADGLNKPVIQLIAEEALASGVEELCIVCAPGDEVQYLARFKQLQENLLTAYKGTDWAKEEAEKIKQLLGRLHFAAQSEPAGYGHAVLQAKPFTASEPFLLLQGDFIYLSAIAGKRCAQQLIEMAATEKRSVSAVNPTIEHQVSRYGTLTGKPVAGQMGAYQIEKILEKPSVSQAEAELSTPGLRAGYYLCFFGMHVFTAELMEILQAQWKVAELNGKPLLLTPAQQTLAGMGDYWALEMKGKRFDLRQPYGLFHAQMALGLAGKDRDLLLTNLVTIMAEGK